MNSQAAPPQYCSGYLARIIRADDDPLTPGARYLLSMRLRAGDVDRIDELSAKAQAGSLTAAETQELDSYLHIGFLLGVLQAKGRDLLKQEPGIRQQ